ncbi:MAG: hypothetical protein K2Y23_13125 [Cyanobacteria bacterium]|nr:hypothetical protein [Cyanobacteriota bacterium]
MLLVAVFLASSVPVVLNAQAGRDAAAKAIEANERAVLSAIQKHDAKGFLAGVTGPDGIAISPGGVMTNAEFLKTLGQVKLESFTLNQRCGSRF